MNKFERSLALNEASVLNQTSASTMRTRHGDMMKGFETQRSGRNYSLAGGLPADLR